MLAEKCACRPQEYGHGDSHLLRRSAAEIKETGHASSFFLGHFRYG